ncbi:MAG: EVE domain-containing protein [Gammaproteobacteria bacterium]|nr:EVE domain-containing protein [Gammaproteobacteria bacterium]
MKYWLMKSEPDAYSIDDLAKEKNQTTHWDGIRNYQARNLMKEMKKGDRAFFYHSSCPQPGIVGIMEIVREAYPDHTAFDKKEKYFDAKSDPDNPRWYMVDVTLVRKFAQIIPLSALRELSEKALKDMVLLRKGNRLSVMPVTKKHWDRILKLE